MKCILFVRIMTPQFTYESLYLEKKLTNLIELIDKHFKKIK